MHVIQKNKEGAPPIITYKELADRVGYELTPRTIATFLGNVSDVCKENGLPYISGIVGNSETSMPGAGYYYYFYGISRSDIESQFKRYLEDLEKIKNCKYWEALLYRIENGRCPKN